MSRSSNAFALKTYDNLDKVAKPLQFEAYEEILEGLEKSELIDLVIKEARNFETHQQEALDEINKELGPLEELIAGVNQDVTQIEELCGSIIEKQTVQDQEDADLNAKMQALSSKNEQFSQQIRDFKEIKQNLSDQRNKEVNNMDKKTYKKLQASMKKHSDDQVVRFLLDSLTKFIKGSEKVEYDAADEIWRDEKSIGVELRNADPSRLDKGYTREMMKQITGESGVEADDGEIYKLISDQANVKKYIDFFPLYRIVSKMCHLAMSIKKEQELQLKMEQQAKTISQIKVRVDIGKKMEGQSLHIKIGREAARSKESELKELEHKREQLLQQQSELEGVDFFAQYFESLDE